MSDAHDHGKEHMEEHKKESGLESIVKPAKFGLLASAGTAVAAGITGLVNPAYLLYLPNFVNGALTYAGARGLVSDNNAVKVAGLGILGFFGAYYTAAVAAASNYAPLAAAATTVSSTLYGGVTAVSGAASYALGALAATGPLGIAILGGLGIWGLYKMLKGAGGAPKEAHVEGAHK